MYVCRYFGQLKTVEGEIVVTCRDGRSDIGTAAVNKWMSKNRPSLLAKLLHFSPDDRDLRTETDETNVLEA